MKQAFFWIPAADPNAAERELNRFLGSHRANYGEGILTTLAAGDPEVAGPAEGDA